MRAPHVDVSEFHGKHLFSTQAKTRRLRSLRRSLPLSIQMGHRPVLDESVDQEDDPLRVEELISFLREGNSIGEL